MSKENQPDIYNFDMQLISDFFSRLPRQGPGSPEQTLRALSFTELPPQPLIADLGCGTGAQTAVLARYTGGTVHALDILPAMVEGVRRRAESEGLESRIVAHHGSMDAPPFAGRLFDLIWAEGSIYNVGFELGFRLWREMLRPGGYIGVTDTCWLSDRRPADMEYMNTNFPDIDDIAGKIAVMQEAGYDPVAHFVLPRSCWTEDFYAPMESWTGEFLEEQGHSSQAREFVRLMGEDLDYYLKNGSEFGYVFFIARKPE